ncbi:hypothetical protein HNQ74_001104 [Bartonella doshiae]|uniref:Uncharacterized protein n=2 Tax=Bartonella doshiae TaxID=33044 RepID=A0A380ZBE2_BARDO|nr:hypothetical protein MCS_01419 [Bartonella doshiae NCTC 12862 = ATCC 700133]MBB6159669.1 hypothetical protein [Bartonella doshiae]SUV44297.1 Uncharacterised protein [Bartonella doshiae]
MNIMGSAKPILIFKNWDFNNEKTRIKVVPTISTNLNDAFIPSI